MKRALIILLALAGVASAQPTVGSGSAAIEQAPPPAEDLPPPTHRYDDVPRLSDGLSDGKLKLPPRTVHQEAPEKDMRPVYVGAGIVVLALVFWLNRRQRDRFEREDEHDGEHDDDEESHDR